MVTSWRMDLGGNRTWLFDSVMNIFFKEDILHNYFAPNNFDCYPYKKKPLDETFRNVLKD